MGKEGRLGADAPGVNLTGFSEVYVGNLKRRPSLGACRAAKVFIGWTCVAMFLVRN